MKRRLAILAVAVVAAGCGGSDEETVPTVAGSDHVEILVGEAPMVQAEVADDDAERAQGLSGRDRLARDAGMYFVLTSDQPRFWMKGMRFPLDIIWIKDGRVVDVSARVPNPRSDVPDSRLPTYSPDRPADHALEVNAGWAKRNGVGRGDEVLYIR